MNITDEPGPIEGLPTLVRLSKAAKQLDVSTKTLREHLPAEAFYRMGRNWAVDLGKLADWVEDQRQVPARTALRADFIRKMGRKQSALRDSVVQDAAVRRVRSALRQGEP